MIRALMLAALLPLPALSAERVVVLGGSVAEIVAALGRTGSLVARDSTSTFPPEVSALPDVGYVRALSAEGVLSVAPDLILAEQGAGPPEAVAVLQAAGVDYVTVPENHTPAGVLDKIRVVAAALDEEDAGEALAQRVAEGLASAEARAASVPQRKRVLFILSLTGGRVTAGGAETAAEGILELAGAINAAEGFSGYKQMTDEAVLAAAPDAILMMDREGDRSITDAQITAHPALSATPAVKTGDILRMDGLLMLGFGPRTPEAAAQLHAALYGAR